MGREIVYCSQCGVRILEKDLAAGRAFTVLDKVFCAECRDQAFTKGAAPEPVSAKAAGQSSPRPAAPTSGARKMTVTAPALAEGRRSSRVEGAPPAPRAVLRRPNYTPIYIGSAIGLVGLIALIAIVMSSGSGKPGTGPGGSPGSGPGGPQGTPQKTLTPSERAAQRFNELHKFAAGATDPAAVVKRAAEAEKDIAGTPTEEEYRKFRKRWERKVEEIEAAKKIDALLAQAKSIAAGDTEFKRHGEVREILQKAEDLAMETGAAEKVADVKNLRRELEEPYEAAADAWFEKYGPGIKQWMKENDFKGALSIIDRFPEPLKLSKVWRVNLTKLREDSVKGKAAQEAKAAGKEIPKEWTYYLRLANEDLQRKNFVRAKEYFLKAEAGMPKIENPTDQDKRRVAWALYYNFGCLFADWSKKLDGDEKTKAFDSAFAYLTKSAEAGVFDLTCGEREHPTAKDHWDKDPDLEKIRGDARYADLIKKYVK